MGFDIPNVHIEKNSPEGRVLEIIVRRDQITPEEAIRRVLRIHADHESAPGEEMIGLFSTVEDLEIMDEAMTMARERRKLDQPRDFHL